MLIGVASNRSIAWGIAEAIAKQRAKIALTYQNEKLKKRVNKYARICNSDIVIPCDVAMDSSMEDTFAELKKHWDKILIF